MCADTTDLHEQIYELAELENDSFISQFSFLIVVGPGEHVGLLVSHDFSEEQIEVTGTDDFRIYLKFFKESYDAFEYFELGFLGIGELVIDLLGKVDLNIKDCTL